MVTILGLKGNNLSFFHLVFHAYFKALLFLTAGAIIHTILDLQDFRKTGGLLNILPVQSILSIIGLTSLIGFPFTTGFYSKEAILNNSYAVGAINESHFNLISTSYSLLSQYSYLILLISALLTIFYSYRFFVIVFLGETKLSIFSFKKIHYFSLHLLIPLFILSILTIIIGFILSKWVHLHSSLYTFSFPFNVPLYIKFLPLLFMIIITAFYNVIFNTFKNYILTNPLTHNTTIGQYIFNTLYYQYSFSLLYKFISGFFFGISYRVFFKIFDYGFLDLLGPISGNYLEKYSKLPSLNLIKNYVSLLLFILLCTL